VINKPSNGNLLGENHVIRAPPTVSHATENVRLTVRSPWRANLKRHEEVAGRR
jgi:hypothetical protein